MGVQLKVDGKTKGPFSESEILEMVESGSVKPTDLAREKGKIKWKPLEEVVPVLGTTTPLIPKNEGGSLDGLLTRSQEIVTKLQSGISKGDDLNGVFIMKVGAGLYVAIMILHLFAMIYFQGFLFWHGLCLLAQTVLAAPFFLKGKSSRFPFAMTVILIVYVLGNSDLLGIQITREYWGAGVATPRNARAATQSPRLQSLEREKMKLIDQRNLEETRIELEIEAATLMVNGKSEQAKKAQKKAREVKNRLWSKLSEEERNKRDKLDAKIGLLNAKIARRKWNDRYDSQSLRRIEVTSALLYIGVFLAGLGAWHARLK